MSNNPVTNPASMLGIFNGTNCAGVANPIAGPNNSVLFQLPVYSNQSPLTGMTYKLFDATTGQISPIGETYAFANGAISGSIGTPLKLHVAIVQNIPVYNGWTWISLSVTSADNTWGSLLQNYPGSNNDVIIGTKGSATYYGGVWYASSGSFIPQAGVRYLIGTSSAFNLSATGLPVTTPISFSLVKGWNWIGCPDASNTTLTAMMSGVTFSDNDLIISQTGQSGTYYGGVWYNTTGANYPIIPGMGYLLYINGQAQVVPLQ